MPKVEAVGVAVVADLEAAVARAVVGAHLEAAEDREGEGVEIVKVAEEDINLNSNLQPKM